MIQIDKYKLLTTLLWFQKQRPYRNFILYRRCFMEYNFPVLVFLLNLPLILLCRYGNSNNHFIIFGAEV